MIESIIFSFKFNIHFGVPKTKHDEGLGTLYGWAPGEPSEHTPAGRNRDAYVRCQKLLEQGLREATWGSARCTSFLWYIFHINELWKVRWTARVKKGLKFLCQNIERGKQNCEETHSSKKELRIRVAIFSYQIQTWRLSRCFYNTK